MKKIFIFVVAMSLLVVGAKQVNACGIFTACPPDTSNATQVVDLVQNQKKLVGAVPVPQMSTSQERLNISKRAQLFNNENKISYIYLISFGKVMSFYTVKGKVSSLRSYMTPQEQIVDSQGNPCAGSTGGCGSSGYTSQAPDIDGSYGDNVDGIFFFTTENAYVEWKGDYMMSDQPLQLTTQPELVRQVK